jgi:hypothetical protein
MSSIIGLASTTSSWSGKACRAQQFYFVSTLKSHRSLFKQGWKLHAGR